MRVLLEEDDMLVREKFALVNEIMMHLCSTG